MAVTVSGALVAAAITGFMTGSAYADSSSGITNSHSTVAGMHVGFNPLNTEGGNDCKGKNACKGKGGCNSGDNGCKGKNSCKGKGGCNTNHPHE